MMKNIIKVLSFLLLLWSLQFSFIYAITADELLEVHKVTTTEMNNIATPQAGSVVFNTTEHTLFFYDGTIWKRLRATGTETIINAGNNVVITGNGSDSTPYTIGQ